MFSARHAPSIFCSRTRCVRTRIASRAIQQSLPGIERRADLVLQPGHAEAADKVQRAPPRGLGHAPSLDERVRAKERNAERPAIDWLHTTIRATTSSTELLGGARRNGGSR